MRNKKAFIIIMSLLGVLIIFGTIHFYNKYNTNKNDNITNYTEANKDNSVLKFLNSIAGVKANNLEIIDNPVGLKGELFAPKESVLKGVDYFLENTENEKMEDLKIDVGDNFISAYVNYKVTNKINTPIEVRVNPKLNENEDLVLNIEEVKFLDLKIANWIVNLGMKSFIRDWFPSNENLKVDVNKGNVVIYKENFNGITIKSLSVEESGLKINVFIDLNQIMN